MIRRNIVMAVLMVCCWSPAHADECNGLRYVDNGNGTVTDCRTGLIWLKTPICFDQSNGIANTTGRLTWYDAMKWTAGLGNGLCGLTDGSHAGHWRLPTRTEFMAMTESARKLGYSNPAFTNAAGIAQWTAGNVFTDVYSTFWTSTTSATNEAMAYFVWHADGVASVWYKADGVNYFTPWPVRGGQTGTFGGLRID